MTWRLLGTTLSLVVIWLAVLFIGVFGGDIVTETGVSGVGGGTRSSVPVVAVVAFFAVIASFFVSWYAFRSEKAVAALQTDRAMEPVREPESSPAPQDTPAQVGDS